MPQRNQRPKETCYARARRGVDAILGNRESAFPHNGMVRRGSLEIVEFEEGGIP
jgi:hypothetical protein